MKTADRLVFFSKGKIAFDAPPDEAFHHYCGNAELRSFIDAVRIS
jgi:hypothetical protein